MPYRRKHTTAGPVTVSRKVVDPETGEETRQEVRQEAPMRGAYYQPGKGSGVGPRASTGVVQQGGGKVKRDGMRGR